MENLVRYDYSNIVVYRVEPISSGVPMIYLAHFMLGSALILGSIYLGNKGLRQLEYRRSLMVSQLDQLLVTPK